MPSVRRFSVSVAPLTLSTSYVPSLKSVFESVNLRVGGELRPRPGRRARSCRGSCRPSRVGAVERDVRRDGEILHRRERDERLVEGRGDRLVHRGRVRLRRREALDVREREDVAAAAVDRVRARVGAARDRDRAARQVRVVEAGRRGDRVVRRAVGAAREREQPVIAVVGDAVVRRVDARAAARRAERDRVPGDARRSCTCRCRSTALAFVTISVCPAA